MTDKATNHNNEMQKLRREIQFANLVRIRGMRELVYFLAHEMSQPLMVISAYVSGCIRRMEENTDDRVQIIHAMKAVDKQVERAGKLINSMKDCVETLELHYAPNNIHQVIEHSLALMTDELRNFPVSIQYHLAKLPLIEIDEAQIKLVILCLLRNSIEEMADAKTSQPKLIIETTKINKHTVSVRITNNGRGIPDTIMNKLFHSRFSTKLNKIGMSLVTCKSIVDSHQGCISAQSLAQGGASFEFALPIKRVS